MLNYFINHKKKCFIIAGSIVAVLVAVFVILNVLKNAYVNVFVTPLGSEVYINGRRYGNGTFRFFPGEIDVEIKHAGLETKKISLTLENGKTMPLHAYLSGENDADFSYYVTNPEDYEVLKIVADTEEAKDFIDTIEKKTSVVDVLPIYHYEDTEDISPVNGQPGRETIISDGSLRDECMEVVCLLVLDNTGSDDVATSLLAEEGYDFGDYQIIRDEYE